MTQNNQTSKDFIDSIKLHEDDNLLVLNKPYGLIVNKSLTSVDNNLQTALAEYLHISGVGDTDSFEARAGIVHRLDKETSGLLLVAKNDAMFTFLQEQFKSRKVKKEYIAIVHGKLPAKLLDIRAPIIRDKRNRTKYAVSKLGKEASTKIIENKEIYYENTLLSYVTAYPYTGRTHQIRVHLCALGTPVLGDEIYSGGKNLKWFMSTNIPQRMYLHAIRIGFFLSEDTETMCWFESPMPVEFTQLISL